MYCAITSEGRFAHITEVARGKACSCVCSKCREPVIARQGEQREWHFAHENGRPPCYVAHESFLHRFVKQTIHDAGGLRLPPPPAGWSIPKALLEHAENGWLTPSTVDMEVTLETVRPDLLLTVGSERLAVEVAYTSFCQAEKIDALAVLGVRALEIDVSHLHPDQFDPDAARHFVLTNDDAKKWLTGLVQTSAASVAEQEHPTVRHLFSVIIAGRTVRLKKLRWGQLLLSYDYGQEVSQRVRHIAHRCGGRWSPHFVNWRINECWQSQLEAELRSAHDPSSLD